MQCLILCMSASQFLLSLSPGPGRRAGAHISPATCKSTDIISAVDEGITRASACKAQAPCPRRWLGADAKSGVHFVFTPAVTLGVSLGWGEGRCTAVPCAGGAAQNWNLLLQTRIYPHFRVVFHHAGVSVFPPCLSAWGWDMCSASCTMGTP